MLYLYTVAPSGWSLPSVTSLTSTSVLISWEEPANLNGILIEYMVERWVNNVSSIVLKTLPPTSTRQYVDEGTQLQPYTEYQYRVSARTGSL